MAVNLNKKDADAIKAAKADYAAAQARGDKAGMDAAHQQAENIRAGYGYSGGADGSQYIAKSSGSSSTAAYTPKDTSGNNYASLAGMSDLHQAALSAARQKYAAAQAAGDTAGMAAAHQQAESIRAGYGYSGGADGSEYILLNQGLTGNFSYQSAPSYTDKYESQIEDLLGQILNRDNFSYNALEDPLYQQYRDQYRREGERAMQDTLGQLSARTGGLASSWAGTAAQQANDYYASMAADKIPELYQLAYSMYMDGIDGKVRDLGLLEQLSDTQYGRYRDTMSDWRDDRNFAYQQYRDDISDQRYGDETAYNRGLYESETEYSRALEKAKLLAAAGDFSGYRALGYSDDEIARLQGAYTLANTPSYSGGGYSGGGADTSGGDTAGVNYEAFFQAARDSGNPESFLKQKSNYKAYGLDSAPSYNDYKNWLTRQNNLASRQSPQNGYVPVADLNAGSNQSGVYTADADKGPNYSSVWQNARRKYDNGASAQEILNYLIQQAQNGGITEAGQDYILRQLHLG